jgi:hypothetical protein
MPQARLQSESRTRGEAVQKLPLKPAHIISEFRGLFESQARPRESHRSCPRSGSLRSVYPAAPSCETTTSYSADLHSHSLHSERATAREHSNLTVVTATAFVSAWHLKTLAAPEFLLFHGSTSARP